MRRTFEPWATWQNLPWADVRGVWCRFSLVSPCQSFGLVSAMSGGFSLCLWCFVCLLCCFCAGKRCEPEKSWKQIQKIPARKCTQEEPRAKTSSRRSVLGSLGFTKFDVYYDIATSASPEISSFVRFEGPFWRGWLNSSGTISMLSEDEVQVPMARLCWGNLAIPRKMAKCAQDGIDYRWFTSRFPTWQFFGDSRYGEVKRLEVEHSAWGEIQKKLPSKERRLRIGRDIKNREGLKLSKNR